MAEPLLERAFAAGVEPFFDGDAQLMIPGYALYHAKVIDSHLRLTDHKAPGSTESVPHGSMAEHALKVKFMQLYLAALAEFLNDETIADDTSAMAVDHFFSALKWIEENQLLEPEVVSEVGKIPPVLAASEARSKRAMC